MNAIKSTSMNATELKNLQSPLKEKYKAQPDTALITLKARGRIGEGISCKVDTGRQLAAAAHQLAASPGAPGLPSASPGHVEAGLHPATGGNGMLACSGDMLLEALVACAGVTLSAVATAIGVEIKSGAVRAEGDLDFRGTLGVSKEAPVGFRQIRLFFDLESSASEEQLASLSKLTERYCVVYQTISGGVPVATQYHLSSGIPRR